MRFLGTRILLCSVSADPTEAGRRQRDGQPRRPADRITRFPLFAGCGCLIVVVLTHVAERFAILPGMGWGSPDSPGHYLDLACATTGLVLLLAGALGRLLHSN